MQTPIFFRYSSVCLLVHVAYTMDHGFLPVSLRLELAGHAVALAEEAAWKEGEEKEEEEGDEDGCKSER
jgi:hypothetical protein